MPELPFPEHKPVFDDLLVQVTPENLLGVHSSLRKQADDLERTLRKAQTSLDVGRCGGDPISADAANMFNAKIGEVLKIHWAHHQEITEAADVLRQTALNYGHSEDEIASALAALDKR